MPIIKGEGGVSEATVCCQPSGDVTMRKDRQFISWSWHEAEQVLDFLQKEKMRRETGSIRELKIQHPGQWLLTELEAMNLSMGACSSLSGIPLWEINDLIKGVISMTPLMAIRVAKVLGKRSVVDGAMGWMHLQAAYDLEQEQTKPAEVATV